MAVFDLVTLPLPFLAGLNMDLILLSMELLTLDRASFEDDFFILVMAVNNLLHGGVWGHHGCYLLGQCLPLHVLLLHLHAPRVYHMAHPLPV